MPSFSPAKPSINPAPEDSCLGDSVSWAEFRGYFHCFMCPQGVLICLTYLDVVSVPLLKLWLSFILGLNTFACIFLHIRVITMKLCRYQHNWVILVCIKLWCDHMTLISAKVIWWQFLWNLEFDQNIVSETGARLKLTSAMQQPYFIAQYLQLTRAIIFLFLFPTEGLILSGVKWANMKGICFISSLHTKCIRIDRDNEFVLEKLFNGSGASVTNAKRLLTKAFHRKLGCN